MAYHLDPIEPKVFATYLAAACGNASPRLEGDWGMQLEVYARSCRSLVHSEYPVEIFMKGLKMYPDLPGSVLRRIIRSCYEEKDVGDPSFFEQNVLPIRERRVRPVTATEKESPERENLPSNSNSEAAPIEGSPVKQPTADEPPTDQLPVEQTLGGATTD